MRITHVWDLTVRDQPWTTELPLLRRSFGFAELCPHMQTHDIDGTVLVQTILMAARTSSCLLDDRPPRAASAPESKTRARLTAAPRTSRQAPRQRLHI